MAAPTRADLLAAADASDAEAELHELEGALLRDRARMLRGLAEKADLTTGHESATTGPPMHVESAGAGRSKGQMSETGKAHPFGKMLERRTTTVGDVAKFLASKLKRKVPRATVQAWYRDVGDPYYRPIRRDAAEALKAEYAVPLSAWPRIRE